MNIFVLDKDPRKKAKMQCDQHIVKIQLETAQMLSIPRLIGSKVNKENNF